MRKCARSLCYYMMSAHGHHNKITSKKTIRNQYCINKKVPIVGPEMPEERWVSQMVQSPDGQGVMVIGGYNATEVYEFRCSGMSFLTDCKWTKTNSTMPMVKFGFLAMMIPDEITNCSS